MIRMRRARTAWQTAAAALALSAGALASVGAQPEALRTLRQRSSAESQASPAPIATVKPPPGLEELAEPFAEAGGLRNADVQAALSRLKAPERPPVAEAPPPPDEATLRQSIRLYVRGKTALVESRFADAAKDLGAAAELNPAAPEPWESLAQAQARAGRMREAVASLRRAYDAGSTDPATLMTWWRALRLERRWEESAQVAVRLREAADATDDPGLSVIADTALGESLLAMGAVSAGSELMAEAIQRAEAVASPRWAEESAELVRRRAEMWTMVGDVRVRLGRFPGALEAYRRAADEPGPDASGLLERRVYALLRSGRVAAAAEAIVEDRDLNTGAEVERTGALMRMVASADPGAPGMISGALVGIADDPATTSATRRVRLVRSAAAGLEPEKARELLLAQLERLPDPGLIDDLLGRLAPGDNVATLVLAGEALNRAPAWLDRVAALVTKRSAGGVDAVLRARAGLGGPAGLPGADAVVAALLVRAGRFEDASKAANEGDRRHAEDPRWLLWRARIAAATADWDAGDRAGAALTAAGERDPRTAALAARALSALQRPEAALRMYERALAAPESAGVAELLGAADLADWLGRTALAESYVMRAATADPQAELPRLRLLEAAGSQSEPDRDQLASMIRELREVAPQSRGLRLIRARELLRARQYAQALGEYSAILSEDPDDDDAGPGLLNVAMSLPATDPALARLRIRVAQLRDAAGASPWPALADAALGVRAAKDEDARAAAVGALDQVLAGTYDGDVLRLWAALSREALGPEAGARRVLEKLAKYPANADVVAARAAAHVQLGDIAAAVVALDTLPTGVGLRPAQAGALLVSLDDPAAAALDALGRPDAPSNAGVRRVIDQAFERSGRLTPQLHAARLQLMVADREVDLPGLVRAAAEAAAQVPDPGAVHLSVVRAFARQGMSQAAVEFSRLAAAAEPPGSAALHVLWLNVAAALGSAEDAASAVRAACDPVRIEATTHELVNAEGQRRTENMHPADIAYDVASTLASRGFDDAVLVYEIALEYDPNHRLTNNDLGYTLLERDERREDAARLIENAYRLEPNDENVIDSMGWLRYMQGRFADEPGSKGAATLLRRAVDLDVASNRGNPTLRDHLGDALYRIGDHAGASKAWHEAQTGAATVLNSAGDNASPRVKKRYTDLGVNARKKQLAVMRGGQPPLAPTWAERDAAKRARPATPAPEGEGP